MRREINSLVYKMAGDSWLTDYDGCLLLGQDLMEQINERSKHTRTSSAYTKISAQIRSKTRQFAAELNKLKQNLMRASAAYHITQREVERRQGMLDALITKEKQIEEATRNEGKPSGLFLTGSTSTTETYSSGDPWGMNEEPEAFTGMSNTELQHQQQHVIREQDRGLEALSHVIGRQKQMALDIGNEVDSQNDLLDGLIEQTDRTDLRIQRETRHIKIVERKSASCCYYIVIALLLVAIVVIAAVPYGGKA